jgi:hypothetical protein
LGDAALDVALVVVVILEMFFVAVVLSHHLVVDLLGLDAEDVLVRSRLAADLSSGVRDATATERRIEATKWA